VEGAVGGVQGERAPGERGRRVAAADLRVDPLGAEQRADVHGLRGQDRAERSRGLDESPLLLEVHRAQQRLLRARRRGGQRQGAERHYEDATAPLH